MKLGWFSPVAPARSEIAAHTARLRPELCRDMDVQFWADGLAAEEQPEFGRRINECDNPALNGADVNVYNMGNNPDFHTGIYRSAMARPGIMVLHDAYMGHFFLELSVRGTADSKQFIDTFAAHYGERGRHAAQDFVDSNSRNIDYEVSGAEVAASGALGIIVHSRMALQAFSNDERPVVYLPLPYTSSPIDVDAGSRRSAVNLTMCGHMGFNRRLHEVLDALAGLSERKHFHLDVFGRIPDTEALSRHIGSLGLAGQVTLHGFVSEQTLVEALGQTDIAINLRYPTMGEASASQLRFWDHALPTLVTRTGWYAEQPEDTVAFVRPEQEREDIQRHLLGFLESPQHYRAYGANGKRLLESDHAPARYVEGVASLAAQCQGLERDHAAYALADRAARAMAEWGPQSASTPFAQSTAAQIWRMFK